jgi:acetoin utilization protein AcuB
MTARELISDSVPSVKTSDTALRVLEWMNEFRVGQLPVVNQASLLGIISEEDLAELDDPITPIGDVRLTLPENAFVYDDSHFFEVLKQSSLNQLDMLPVLVHADSSYLGMITRKDIVNQASSILAAQEPGGVVVLEVDYNSYTLSEIARICESNDAKVLSLTVTNSPTPLKLYVTLKLNIRELTRLLATFERFSYEVVQVVTDSEQLDDFKDRYENFLRYLNP